MNKIDPAMANRVWQRVQDSLNPPEPAPCQLLPPIPVYTVPPEAWKTQTAASIAPRRKPAGRPCRCCQPQGIHPALLLLLLGGKLF